MPAPLLIPLALTALPYPVYLQFHEFATHDRYLTHQHPWGQLSYSASGIMELNIAGQHYLVPPHYALWCPPNIAHDAVMLEGGRHHSIYIDATLSSALSPTPCALMISPILKAIIEDFASRRLAIPETPADRRLLEVMLDQIQSAPCTSSYLPFSNDPLLSKILRALQSKPADSRSLTEWAATVHVTERTLARRFQKVLGLRFVEWRQRLRFLAALPRLETGERVERIALDLGYASASAFINMFQQHAGMTPDRYRQQLASKAED